MVWKGVAERFEGGEKGLDVARKEGCVLAHVLNHQKKK